MRAIRPFIYASAPSFPKSNGFSIRQSAHSLRAPIASAGQLSLVATVLCVALVITPFSLISQINKSFSLPLYIYISISTCNAWKLGLYTEAGASQLLFVMTARYTIADKSLWDDTDLLRLYNEQLELEKSRGLGDDLVQRHSISTDSHSPSPSSNSGRERSSGTVDEAREKSRKTHAKEACASSGPGQAALLPSEGVPAPLPATAEGLGHLKDVMPLLQAYYQAGYAAGHFSATQQHQRKRGRSNEE
eukprot:gene13250-9093_t